MISEEFHRLRMTLEQSDIDPTQIDLITKYIYQGQNYNNFEFNRLQQQFKILQPPQQLQKQNQPAKSTSEEQNEINKQNQFEKLGENEDNVSQNFGSQPNQGEKSEQEQEQEPESESESEQESGQDSEQQSGQDSEQQSGQDSEYQSDSDQEPEIQQQQGAVNNNNVQGRLKNLAYILFDNNSNLNKWFQGLKSTFLGELSLTLSVNTIIISLLYLQGTYCQQEENNQTL